MHLNLKICALVALCVSAGAQATSSWQLLKVGAGGFVRGLAVAPDGTMVVKTDTNGGYLWNGWNSSTRRACQLP
jgi:glucose/arabinose dehydrogenase